MPNPDDLPLPPSISGPWSQRSPGLWQLSIDLETVQPRTQAEKAMDLNQIRKQPHPRRHKWIWMSRRSYDGPAIGYARTQGHSQIWGTFVSTFKYVQCDPVPFTMKYPPSWAARRPLWGARTTNRASSHLTSPWINGTLTSDNEGFLYLKSSMEKVLHHGVKRKELVNWRLLAVRYGSRYGIVLTVYTVAPTTRYSFDVLTTQTKARVFARVYWHCSM